MFIMSGEGVHIFFGADPICVGIGIGLGICVGFGVGVCVTLSCLHNIL